ncbi:MAG: YggT family protein [Clostridia bacterium]|nr:YggT family protein [Clostridia bacterium]
MERKPVPTQRNIKARKITYYILGALETLFAFRLIFKVLGANPESTFVNVIYSLTNIFLAPFEGIFRMAVTDGIETQSVLEPQLLIAMISYAVLAWGIVKLIELNGKQKDIVE